MRELFPREVRLQVVDVLPQALNLAMLRLAEVPDQHVHGAAVFREIRGRLLGEKNAGPLRDREAAVDRVVVRQRDEIHAARAQGIVKLSRLGVAGGQSGAAEKPLRRAVAETRVEMKVSFQSPPSWASR